MSQIKIQSRPGQTIRFPGICVHCAQPAAETMQIKKRVGRVTRLINLPICPTCAHATRLRSGLEEKWHQGGLYLTIVLSLLTLAVGLLLTPASWPFLQRLAVAVMIGGVVGTAVFTFARIQQRRVALPEKQAVRDAAAIDTFSWRSTTFNFRNEAFCERFKSINESLIMEI